MVTAMRVVLIGRTGAGKSHFCKALGAPAESRVGSRRVTSEWTSFPVKVKGQSVTVVDTPGFYDRDNAITAENLKQVNAALTSEPFTFVLYVFKAGSDGRFEGDDQEGLLMVSRALGEENVRRMVVLINMCAVPQCDVGRLFMELIRDVTSLHKGLAEVVMLPYVSDSRETRQEMKILEGMLYVKVPFVRIQGKVTRLVDEERKKLAAELESIKRELKEADAQHAEAIRKIRDSAKTFQDGANQLKEEARLRKNELQLLQTESVKLTEELMLSSLVHRLETIFSEVRRLKSKTEANEVVAMGGALVAMHGGLPFLSITAGSLGKTLMLNRKIRRLLDEAEALCAGVTDVKILALNKEIQGFRPHGVARESVKTGLFAEVMNICLGG